MDTNFEKLYLCRIV
nr:unnamed protein product [Callosobruchus chinensis]